MPLLFFCVPHQYCLPWTHVWALVHAFSWSFFGYRSLKRAYEQSYAFIFFWIAGLRPPFRLPQAISTPTQPFRLHHLYFDLNPSVLVRYWLSPPILTITTHIFRSTTPEICSSLLPMLPGIPVSFTKPSGMKDYGRNILVNDGSWDIAWIIRWLERQVQLCQWSGNRVEGSSSLGFVVKDIRESGKYIWQSGHFNKILVI